MKYCIKCGEELSKENIFCESCGTKVEMRQNLAEDDKKDFAANKGQDTNSGKKKLKKKVLIVSLISLLTGGALAFFLFNKEPQETLSESQLYQLEQLKKIEASKQFIKEVNEQNDAEATVEAETVPEDSFDTEALYESEDIISGEELNGYWYSEVDDKFISFDFNRGATGDFTIHDFGDLKMYSIEKKAEENGDSRYFVTQDGETLPFEISMEDENTVRLAEFDEVSLYTRSNEEALFESYVEYESAAMDAEQ